GSHVQVHSALSTAYPRPVRINPNAGEANIFGAFNSLLRVLDFDDSLREQVNSPDLPVLPPVVLRVAIFSAYCVRVGGYNHRQPPVGAERIQQVKEPRINTVQLAAKFLIFEVV